MDRYKIAGLVLFLVTSMFTTAARANTVTATATLTGSQEVPANGSTAVGSITVTLDLGANLLTVSETFSGLVGGPAAAAHIHCCGPAGINEPVAVPFTGFPNATSGTYTSTFDLTNPVTYNPAFLTANGGTAAGAEAALIAGLEAGNAYANIHDATYPGGEIRGQLHVVPEPSSLLFMGSGVAGLLGMFRRKLVQSRCGTSA